MNFGTNRKLPIAEWLEIEWNTQTSHLYYYGKRHGSTYALMPVTKCEAAQHFGWFHSGSMCSLLLTTLLAKLLICNHTHTGSTPCQRHQHTSICFTSVWAFCATGTQLKPTMTKGILVSECAHTLRQQQTLVCSWENRVKNIFSTFSLSSCSGFDHYQ